MNMEQLAVLIYNAPRVYICGNGGSAANAMHMANDLIAVGIKAHALTADIATLTCIANDYGYDQVFSRQLMVFGSPSEVVICLSGSGNSKNILMALDVARHLRMISVAVTDGGEAADRADHHLQTPGGMQYAEEKQIHVGHLVSKMIFNMRGPIDVWDKQ